MKRLRCLLMTVSLAFSGSPALAEPSPSESEAGALGQRLVERNCAMCHAVGRTGTSPNAAAPAFRDLHRRMDVEMLGEGLAQGILTDHPAMPEFRFSPNEVVAIVRYLRSIQERQTVRAPRRPAAGR